MMEFIMEKITIIGYGRFGRLLEEIINHYFNKEVNIYDPRFPRRYTEKSGYHPLESSDLIIVAVPLDNFESTLKHISPLLKAHQTILEVCSTSIYPKKIMQEILPPEINLIGSHPMFGPQTLKNNNGTLEGLNVVLENIKSDEKIYTLVRQCIQSMGCKVTEMSADEHDKQAAKFHFLAQLVGTSLKPLCLQQTQIDTKSYEFLFHFMQRLDPDKELLKMMYTYNPYSKKYLDNYQKSFQGIVNFLKEK